MEKILISDIKENQKIDTIFLVKGKSSATGKTGKPYIYLKLSDKTGEIKGYIWDNVEKYNGLFDVGDFIKIKSKSSIFQNELQLSVSELKKIDKTDIDENLLALFLKSTKYDVNIMFSELINILDETLTDEYIIMLTKKFLHDEDYVKKLKTMPAAKSIHHGYIGGLLEHTLSMVRIGVFISKHYEKYINKDILIASILLHDAGKTEELGNKNNNITEYSDEGKLLGHIVLGANIIDKKIGEIEGFPRNLRTLLLHSVISHHGELEFGSPKRPKTIEALLLHFIDNMDAKTNQFIETIETQVTPWGPYLKQLDRYLLNSKIFYSGRTDATPNLPIGTPIGTKNNPEDYSDGKETAVISIEGEGKRPDTDEDGKRAGYESNGNDKNGNGSKDAVSKEGFIGELF
ncbi:MAG: HD domain-containing protein [Deltaproteobacteria bacterium]|nr:HD domain-containing protein [Deltaproteobacteria bacterium]